MLGYSDGHFIDSAGARARVPSWLTVEPEPGGWRIHHLSAGGKACGAHLEADGPLDRAQMATELLAVGEAKRQLTPQQRDALKAGKDTPGYAEARDELRRLVSLLLEG